MPPHICLWSRGGIGKKKKQKTNFSGWEPLSKPVFSLLLITGNILTVIKGQGLE